MAEIYEGVKFQTHILTSSDIIQFDVKLSCHLQAALNFFQRCAFFKSMANPEMFVDDESNFPEADSSSNRMP